MRELVTKSRAKPLAESAWRALEVLTRHWPHSRNVRSSAGRTLGTTNAALAALLEQPTRSRLMLLTLAALLERRAEMRTKCYAGALLERPTRRWPHSWSGRHEVAIHVADASQTLGACDETRVDYLAGALLGCSERCWPHFWNDRRGAGSTLGAGDTKSRFMLLTLAALVERVKEMRAECLASAFLGRSERSWPHSWNDRRGASRTLGAADTTSRFMLLTLAALLELVTQTRADYLAGALLGRSERRWPHSWNDRRGAGRTLGAADTKSRLMLLTLAALLERVTETRAECLASAFLGRSERRWPHSWNDRRGAGRTLGAADTKSRLVLLTLAALLERGTETRAKCLAGALLGRCERRWPHSWNNRRGAGRTIGAADTKSRFMLLTLAAHLERVTETRAECLASAFLGRSELAALLERPTRRWPHSWSGRHEVAIHVADASHTLGACDETRVDYLAGALLGCSERCWPHFWNDRRGAGSTLGAGDTKSRFMLLTLAALVERVTEMCAECLASAFLGRSERRWPHSWNDRRGASRTLGAADTTSRFMLLTLAALLELVTQTRAAYLAGALLGLSERRWPHSWNDRRGAGRTLGAADTKSRLVLLTLAALLERGTETRAKCLAGALLGRFERCWPHSWNDRRGAGRTIGAADTKSRFMLLTLAALLELVTQTRAAYLAGALLGLSERRWPHSWNDRRGAGSTLGAGDTKSRLVLLTLAALVERVTEMRA